MAVVEALATVEAAAAPPLAQALSAMLEAEEARRAVAAAGGTAALAAALLGCADAAGRLAIALCLATLVDGDWKALADAAGWEAVVATLGTAAAASPSMAQLAGAATPALLRPGGPAAERPARAQEDGGGGGGATGEVPI